MNRKILRNLFLLGALWYANGELTQASGADSCWYLCNPWVDCGTPCTIGSETWITCGEYGDCDPG